MTSIRPTRIYKRQGRMQQQHLTANAPPSVAPDPRSSRYHRATGSRGRPAASIMESATSVVTATPPTSIFRMALLIAFSLLTVGAITTFGIVMVKQLTKETSASESFKIAQKVIRDVEIAIGGVSPVPVCTTVDEPDIGTTFSDALFSVYTANDITSKIRFDLSALEPNGSSDVVLTIRDQDLTVIPNGGTIAYRSDIPSTINTEFADAEFAVRNSADPQKRMRISLDPLWFNAPLRTQDVGVQSASGTVAYLDNIDQFGGFLDDVFAVYNDVNSGKHIMFDASNVPSDDTVKLSIQNSSGTILLLADTVALPPPFADGVFRIQHSLDTSAKLRFVLDNLIPDVPVTLRIRDISGTVAYLDDTPEFFEIWVNTSRQFPSTLFEGTDVFSGLGNISVLEISFCGGGGGGGAQELEYAGAGGGSGSGFEQMRILNPQERFDNFQITIGAGGVGNPGGHGSDGNRTRIEGNSSASDLFYLDMSGWGGGGGGRGTAQLAKGGCGGGNGGGAFTVANGTNTTINTPGPAGDLGGFEGGLGGRVDGQPSNGASGALAGGWRAGGGGGGNDGNGAPWLHGRPSLACPDGGCGADGMFGYGGRDGSPDGGYCAGGSRGPSTGGGKGGDGIVYIRYILDT